MKRVAALAFVISLVPQPGPAFTAGPPMDYIAQRSLLSQPTYPTLREQYRVPMAHDGAELYVEVERPDGGQDGDVLVPTIMEISPYHGTNHDRDGARIFPDDPGGLTGYFAPRGYAVVMVDLRGTGRSGGCLDHLGPSDAKDMREIVEWAAHPDRAWNGGAWGKVALTGHSYVGSTPQIAAAQRPRGLVTIVPSAGLASMYDHQFQWGVPYNLQWVGPMASYEELALQRYRDDYPLSADNAAGVGCGLPSSSLTAGHGQLTGQYQAWHAARDHRDAAADVDIPIFIVHGVNDDAARIAGAEWFFGRRFGRPGDKVWIGQWTHGSGGHINRRFDQWKYALHAWFDRHLKGMGVDTGPAVEAFLNDNILEPFDPVVTDTGWRRPAERLALYPDARDGTLGLAPPDGDGAVSFTPVQGGFGRALFTSAPLAVETVFLGVPRLRLDVSVTSPALNVVTTLRRLDVIGNRSPMNYCAMQPMLRFHPATPAPVVPGEVMDLHPQCFTMAHRVKAGERIELEVSTSSVHHVETFSTDAQITVHTGALSTAYELPVLPDTTVYPDVPLRE